MGIIIATGMVPLNRNDHDISMASFLMITIYVWRLY